MLMWNTLQLQTLHACLKPWTYKSSQLPLTCNHSTTFAKCDTIAYNLYWSCCIVLKYKMGEIQPCRRYIFLITNVLIYAACLLGLGLDSVPNSCTKQGKLSASGSISASPFMLCCASINTAVLIGLLGRSPHSCSVLYIRPACGEPGYNYILWNREHCSYQKTIHSEYDSGTQHVTSIIILYRVTL